MCDVIRAAATDRLINSELSKFLNDSTKLTDRLVELCNKTFDAKQNQFSLSQHLKPLQRLLEDRRFSQIMLPLQSLMTVTLPSGGKPAQHEAFPGEPVLIAGFEDTVELLPSLVRPKKVVINGTDGRLYVMLCKPKVCTHARYEHVRNCITTGHNNTVPAWSTFQPSFTTMRSYKSCRVCYALLYGLRAAQCDDSAVT